MERYELNRMFDQLAPTPEQEEEGLRRLLQTERKDRPMKKLKKMTVLGIAAVLVVAAMGAGLAWRQIPFNFIRPDDDPRVDPQEVDPDAGYVFSEFVFDVDTYLASNNEVVEREKSSLELSTELVPGGPDDCWTRMRTSVTDAAPCGTVQDDYYQGDSLLKLGELLDAGWNVSWLEEHYTPIPGGQTSGIRTHLDEGMICTSDLSGLYRGEDGAQFSIIYERNTELEMPDTWDMWTRDHTEEYVTKDGAKVYIITGNDKAEQPIFRAAMRFDLHPGYVRFELTGIYMDLEDVYTLLDSLHLSNLTK